MKNLLFIILFFPSFTLFSQFKFKEQTQFASCRVNPIITNGSDSSLVTSFSYGIGFGKGEKVSELERWDITFAGSYKYIIPFISVDCNLSSSETYNSPISLNMGMTGGMGGHFLYLFGGINATLGANTDFKDVYLKYGLAFDVYGLSLGFGGLLNLTHFHNSSATFLPGIELRYIWNWNNGWI